MATPLFSAFLASSGGIYLDTLFFTDEKRVADPKGFETKPSCGSRAV
jgi:hypothetical protein